MSTELRTRFAFFISYVSSAGFGNMILSTNTPVVGESTLNGWSRTIADLCEQDDAIILFFRQIQMESMAEEAA